MTSRARPFNVFALLTIFAGFYIGGLPQRLGDFFAGKSTHLATFLVGLLLVPILKRIFSRLAYVRETLDGSNSSVYGLHHGRLHITSSLPLWMNMGFWHQSGQIDEEYGKDPKTLAAASRNLLSHVLKTAGFPWEEQSDDSAPYKHQARVLLDLGFGCGDQTVYLMSPKWVRKSDQMWWGCGIRVPCFNSYTGITLDSRQFAYAQERVRELRTCKFESAEDYIHGIQNTRLFHADAARPAEWNDELRNHVIATFNQVEDGWVLALDTLYHFSPSRWQVIEFTSRTLNASLMAFDLCLSERISLTSLLLLRITTVLMGAPWANFVTQDQYHAKLIEAGYQEITITDISEHVFAPLAAFMEEQDRTLRVLGFGLGPFHLARWMFRWWAQTGIVRGIVVIAKR